MNKNFNGLTVVNLELTSKCQKACFCCGRRKLEKEHPELCNFGDMDFSLAKSIIDQLPKGIIIQYHNNGEPLLYPYLKEILGYSKGFIRAFNTNAILLLDKMYDIIDNMESITISVIGNDPLQDEQYEIVKKFLDIKGSRKPLVVFRLLGNVGKKDWFFDEILESEIPIAEQFRRDRWYNLAKGYDCIIATRILHSPDGSFNYTKKVTIPETGFCLDLLNHLAINRYGQVSICVRFDPMGYGIIGDLRNETLEEIWNGQKRKYYLQEHIKGNRRCNYLCSTCDYWGIPMGN